MPTQEHEDVGHATGAGVVSGEEEFLYSVHEFLPVVVTGFLLLQNVMDGASEVLLTAFFLYFVDTFSDFCLYFFFCFQCLKNKIAEL